MGTVFKPKLTRPLPRGAEIIEKSGERIARWRSARGGLQTAPVRTTPRGDCIVVESGKYLARYRDGQGAVQTVPTGCREEMPARAKLADLERRAELVKAGVLTAAEDAVGEHRRTTITSHVEAYLAALKARETTPEHQAAQRRLLSAVIEGCRFRALADVKREPVERWLATGPISKRAARTKNTYRAALLWFVGWCVDTERLVANPVARLHRFDEAVDRRRQPRALSPDELQHLLDAAAHRPLAEAAQFNRGWRKGQPGARIRPETRVKLEWLGRERALIYKTLVLTGLRLGELTALRVCDAVLDGPSPHLVLDARHEKARRGATIPLRPDLRDDLAAWCVGRARTDRLFAIPQSFVHVFDRDLAFAGIEKRDERGRTACVHSLRHSLATLLSQANVPPRVTQAAMRHASIEMSMGVYSDPRLLDVAGALDALPTLPLNGTAHVNPTAARPVAS